MAQRITPQGELLEGGTDANALLYVICKLIFGADAQGIVTIPDDLTAAPTSLANDDLIAEIKSKS